MKKNYKWTLKDIIMIGIISVIFAVIYLWTVYASISLNAMLMPFGLYVFANELVFGIWFMAATFAAYIIRKPGVAIVAEMLAAFIEVLMGNMYGPIVFVSGFIQGAGAEIVFASTKYKRFDLKTLTLASLGCSVTSFAWGFIRSGFFDLSPLLLIVMFAVRFTSAFLFSTLGSKLIADKLASSGVLKGYPISADFESNLEVYEN